MKLNTSGRPGDWLEFIFSSMQAAVPEHELKCAAGNDNSCYVIGSIQANTLDIPDAKKTLAEGCDKGTWQIGRASCRERV